MPKTKKAEGRERTLEGNSTAKQTPSGKTRKIAKEDEKGRNGKRLRKDEALLESSSSSSSDSDEDALDTVNVDFEFFDPKGEDYHGVKALLRSYLGETTWDLGGLVDAILSQTTVGTVIKTGDDESPIGVISALNVGKHKDQNFMRSIRQFLCGKCTVASDVAELAAILDKHPSDVCLLVSERLINVPGDVAPPLYRGLLDEILWATEDEPTQELCDMFKFKYYLIVTRIFQHLPKGKVVFNKKQERGIRSTLEEQGELIYPKPEDELLHELSQWSCKFPVTAEALAAHEVQGLRQFHLVMLLNAQQIEIFRTQFCTS